MTALPSPALPAVPMEPLAFQVVSRERETPDTVTIEIEALDRGIENAAPGQFAMLWAFGIGEVPISFSRIASNDRLHHTIRDVGPVTRALSAAETGAAIGVRGPFGNGWEVGDGAGRDVLIVAGGLGLAPLRPAIDAVLGERDRYGRVVILLGARTPTDLLFAEDVGGWRDRPDVEVHTTVDSSDAGWHGEVGVVTNLIGRVNPDPGRTMSLLCGPEVMMRFTARALVDRGLDPDHIRVSLERNMQCGTGHCGHCQLGPELVCLDGPVFPWARAARLLAVRER